jgi:hypothetical protein
MNNPELNSILKKARTPQPPEDFLEEFPQQIARQLNRARTENFRPQRNRNWIPRFAWGFAMAICILAAFAIGNWRGQMKTKTVAANDILENAKFVRETLAMFPNQVRAIVKDDRGLNLVLSEKENVPASPPIYVHICDGKNCSSFVTFSGQEIQIAGQKMTVLSNARGGIILTGNQFAWSSDEQTLTKNHLKIEAKNLSATIL